MTTKTYTNDQLNSMIFKTLRTWEYDEPKYKDILEAHGYELGNKNRRWSVKRNGLELAIREAYKGSGLVLELRSSIVEKLANIKRVDFVGYFETSAARKGSAWNVTDDGKIYQTRHQGFQRRWYGARCWGYSTKRHERGYRHTIVKDENKVVAEYKELKRKATQGCEWGHWGGVGEYEHNIERNNERIKYYLECIEEEQRKLAKNYEKLAEAKLRAKGNEGELDSFLKAHGIR